MGRIIGDNNWERSIKWWMIDYILFCSLERLRDKILEFKQSRDPQLFSLLLLRLDRFAIYVCARFKRQYTFLAYVPMEDLYHTAVVAIYKSLISMPDNWKTELILQRVKSYIKQEFFTDFDDKIVLRSCSLDANEWDYQETKSAQNLEDQVNCSMILDSLTADDRSLIVKKIMENRTFEALRKDHADISKQALSFRVNKILKKCRSLIDK